MQKDQKPIEPLLITPDAPVLGGVHGGRAKCLQRLVRLGLPVPPTVALDFAAVRGIASGAYVDGGALLEAFAPDALVSVRPSSEDPDWGGPGTILNIGMNDARHAALAARLGRGAADALYRRFIQSYTAHVARLDPDLHSGAGDIREMLAAFEAEMDEPFPQSPGRQLAEVLRAMAQAWEGTSARLLRQAKGAPPDAGLGLVVQAMALGVGDPAGGESGAGVIQFVSSSTGEPRVTGRYLGQSQGREALGAGGRALYLTRDPRGPSLEDLCPDLFDSLQDHGLLCRRRLREEMQIEFVIHHGALWILDAVRVRRSSRAAVRIAVDLATDGVIPQFEAVLRIEPRALNDLLHRQVDPDAVLDRFGNGIAASPGAATGRIVFSARAAQASAAREEPCILVRRETKPEDVRGMHVSAGVLTERGGVTSHAAMIARGLGLPAVVGASKLHLDHKAGTLTTEDGRVLGEGDVITIDGSSGSLITGAAPLLEPVLDDAFRSLLGWADALRDIGVRANADTPAEAVMARRFEAEGIGLCRTEHMFFEEDRLTVMREMIFAERPEDRAAALERLLPVQRADYSELFRIMDGYPVCIRLLDPPLHEFLPADRAGMLDLARALGLPLSQVADRIAALSELNPMLGMRGVRLGIAVPEIYAMQARAIFEAAVQGESAAVPEVMIPLVSARREVELVKAQIDGVAAAVRSETGRAFDYRLGVMVETPRAALRAGDIAESAMFLSFGTNDLTQMTYGLSRDDAGHFMNAYVSRGVFDEDPFLKLDMEGVGELLSIGAARGRAVRPDIILSVCGEHGGDPDSIAFCRNAGFSYVSCSPFRVPLARLAAAHLAIRDSRNLGNKMPQ
ncbi:putative PEP-binding protein [Profundibacterium mesophilum]|uniref:Pyruvate, phosphate dikinase n=1 Tax=Profundibacterium mesophilum KAUST100406-0324 TaxID=1037889 RepID=A0A921NXY5_9RHOB|nr:putative PEP-binding protein [Profundibacterium mesophilum]KAF0677396.1 Pyruvate phosphate dikinase [Profundibacterium mesophilum KAUST100406-0324]